jgi:hypothetical protein
MTSNKKESDIKGEERPIIVQGEQISGLIIPILMLACKASHNTMSGETDPASNSLPPLIGEIV